MHHMQEDIAFSPGLSTEKCRSLVKSKLLDDLLRPGALSVLSDSFGSPSAIA
jgi:hypothetical protein